MVLYIPRPTPWSEIAHLPIIPIIGKPQFGANQKNLFIEDDDAAVIPTTAVCNWPFSKPISV